MMSIFFSSPFWSMASKSLPPPMNTCGAGKQRRQRRQQRLGSCHAEGGRQRWCRCGAHLHASCCKAPGPATSQHTPRAQRPARQQQPSSIPCRGRHSATTHVVNEHPRHGGCAGALLHDALDLRPILALVQLYYKVLIRRQGVGHRHLGFAAAAAVGAGRGGVTRGRAGQGGAGS